MNANWNDRPQLLHDYIEARRRMPFAWGSNDCCLFAADWILAYTGIDHAKKWRGYRDEKGAARRIAKVGGIENFMADFKQKGKGFAQRGDIVIADLDGRKTMGIACGNGTYCAPGPDGLVFRSMKEVLLVFEV